MHLRQGFDPVILQARMRGLLNTSSQRRIFSCLWCDFPLSLNPNIVNIHTEQHSTRRMNLYQAFTRTPTINSESEFRTEQDQVYFTFKQYLITYLLQLVMFPSFSKILCSSSWDFIEARFPPQFSEQCFWASVAFF